MFMRYSRSYDKLERIKVVVGSLSKTTVEEVSVSAGNSNEVAPKSIDSIEKTDSYKEDWKWYKPESIEDLLLHFSSLKLEAITSNMVREKVCQLRGAMNKTIQEGMGLKAHLASHVALLEVINRNLKFVEAIIAQFYKDLRIEKVSYKAEKVKVTELKQCLKALGTKSNV
ncbi:hypothetical protein GH714_019064 [Hevea brasiliensis]|uniref:Uncharacterized protein n=1 Tax=Hevea brasiliensis TaxID=3981 RepID=A0A6A6LAY1_HEVBR|nr:hypothetical protein GH714_019064 [Hevea brasiliensis]